MEELRCNACMRSVCPSAEAEPSPMQERFTYTMALELRITPDPNQSYCCHQMIPAFQSDSSITQRTPRTRSTMITHHYQPQAYSSAGPHYQHLSWTSPCSSPHPPTAPNSSSHPTSSRTPSCTPTSTSHPQSDFRRSRRTRGDDVPIPALKRDMSPATRAQPRPAFSNDADAWWWKSRTKRIHGDVH